MFGKKDGTSLHGSEIVFQKNEVDFGNFKEYCANYVTNGDWAIPLGLYYFCNEECDEPDHDDTAVDFMRTYDDRLINILRRQDSELVIKNPRMLGYKDPKKKGLYGKILKLLDKAERTINKMPERKVGSICNKIRGYYDKKMQDPTTGQQIETHIWIPVWDVTAKKALVVSILGRINLVIT